MYSFVPPETYEGVDATGAVRPLRTDDLPLVVMAVDTGRLVPGRLCERDPGLQRVRRSGGPEPGEFAC